MNRALATSILATLALAALTLAPSTCLSRVVHAGGEGYTIQQAIDAAAPGDTVVVLCGTYFEHDIEMKSGIVLRSIAGQADCVTIDAAGEGRVMRCDGVVDAKIEGFTFTGGLTPASGQWHEISGGGLACVDSDLRLVNLVFENNTGHLYGGGMWCHGSSPFLTNVAFIGNNVASVGGVGNGGGLSANHESPVVLADVVFLENTAGAEGGGAYFTGSPGLTRCRFEGNVANWGGGLSCDNAWCSPHLADVTIVGNSAYAGGGLVVKANASLVLEGVTIAGNAADYGAGIDIAHDSVVTIENSVIASNYPDTGVSCFLTPAPVLTCCDIFGNEGGDWVGCISDQYGAEGNFSEDPLFCDPTGGDYGLCEDSPCAPGNHPSGVACGLVGASGVACDPCGTSGADEMSWGAIKASRRPSP